MKQLDLYEKPEIEYWPAQELDAIVATMSGGSGGSGIRLKWDDNWVDSGSENGYALAISAVTTMLCTILTRNLATGEQVAASLVSSIAADIVSAGFATTYYTRRIQHLYMYAGYSAAGVDIWDLVGSAVKADYFSDSSHNNLIGSAEWNNVPSAFSYALSSLSW